MLFKKNYTRLRKLKLTVHLSLFCGNGAAIGLETLHNQLMTIHMLTTTTKNPEISNKINESHDRSYVRNITARPQVQVQMQHNK
jgi:hypothetical protein